MIEYHEKQLKETQEYHTKARQAAIDKKATLEKELEELKSSLVKK